MGIPVMIYGSSGTGKSRSLKFFTKGEISVINVSKKPFPFKAEFASISTSDYRTICEAMMKTSSPSIAIDDATYLMVDAYMKRANEKSYDKFSQIAADFYNLIQFIINNLPPEKIVYIIGHKEHSEDGCEKFKTIGKMLDSTVCLEGLHTIVLKTVVKDGHYFFSTQNNGNDTVKSPEGLFDAPEVENNLKAIDDAIRNFYGIEVKK